MSEAVEVDSNKVQTGALKELDICPFCGDTAIMNYDYIANEFAVSCLNVGHHNLKMRSKDRDWLIRQWNKRIIKNNLQNNAVIK